MKKSKVTETQIVLTLKQADAWVLVKDTCRQAGIRVPTYYQWKLKYGGLEASDLRSGVQLATSLALGTRSVDDPGSRAGSTL